MVVTKGHQFLNLQFKVLCMHDHLLPPGIRVTTFFARILSIIWIYNLFLWKTFMIVEKSFLAKKFPDQEKKSLLAENFLNCGKIP